MSHEEYTDQYGGQPWAPALNTNDVAFNERPIDPFAKFIELVPMLVEKARRSEQFEGHSYRGFHVGAAALAYDALANRIGVFSGANYKDKISEDEREHTDLHDIPKVCAEADIVARASDAGFSRIIGFLVVATTNRQKIKEVTGIATATLEPCNDCIRIFDKNPIVGNRTMVVTMGAKENIYQAQTVGEIKERREAGSSAAEAKIYQYDFSEWGDRAKYYENIIKKSGRKMPKAGSDISRSKKRIEIAQKALIVPRKELR